MSAAPLKRCAVLAEIRNATTFRAQISLATVAEIARIGVDLISVGELTHTVRAADLSMRIEAF